MNPVNIKSKDAAVCTTTYELLQCYLLNRGASLHELNLAGYQLYVLVKKSMLRTLQMVASNNYF